MSTELEYHSAQGYNINGMETEAGCNELIASVYSNVNSFNQRIMPGFFDQSIAEHNDGSFLIKGLYMHDWHQPIASTLVIKSVDANDSLLPAKVKPYGGLYIKSKYNLDTQIGAETYSNISKKILDQYSIGFTKKDYTINSTDQVMELYKGKLWEWSVVLFGANELTSTLAREGLLTNVSNLEMAINRHLSMVKHEGRKLSSDSVDRIERSITMMEMAAKEMRTLIAEATPVTGNSAASKLMHAAKRHMFTNNN